MVRAATTGQADKAALQEKLQELCYWNDRLEGLLPEPVRRSILQQALPGTLIRDDNGDLLAKLMEVSNHQSLAVRTHAKLWKEKLQFNDQKPVDKSIMQKYLRDDIVPLDIPGLSPSECGLSIMSYQEAQNRRFSFIVAYHEFLTNCMKLQSES